MITVKTEPVENPETTVVAKASGIEAFFAVKKPLKHVKPAVLVKSPPAAHASPSAPPAPKLTKMVGKPPKGIRTVLKARRPLDVQGVSKEFECPPPVPHNRYWVYFAVPQKELFLDLLNTGNAHPPPIPEPPAIDNRDIQLTRHDAERYEVLQRAQAQAQQGQEGADQGGGAEAELSAIEQGMQRRALAHSEKIYTWTQERDAILADYNRAQMAANETKVQVLDHLEHVLKSQAKHINVIQKAVNEVELNRAIDSVGGSDGVMPDPDTLSNPAQAQAVQELKERVVTVLEKIGDGSRVKASFSKARSVVQALKGPLKAHIPIGKLTSAAFCAKGTAGGERSALSVDKANEKGL
jgi:hypothetical protein